MFGIALRQAARIARLTAQVERLQRENCALARRYVGGGLPAPACLICGCPNPTFGRTRASQRKTDFLAREAGDFEQQ